MSKQVDEIIDRATRVGAPYCSATALSRDEAKAALLRVIKDSISLGDTKLPMDDWVEGYEDAVIACTEIIEDLFK